MLDDFCHQPIAQSKTQFVPVNVKIGKLSKSAKFFWYKEIFYFSLFDLRWLINLFQKAYNGQVETAEELIAFATTFKSRFITAQNFQLPTRG